MVRILCFLLGARYRGGVGRGGKVGGRLGLRGLVLGVCSLGRGEPRCRDSGWRWERGSGGKNLVSKVASKLVEVLTIPSLIRWLKTLFFVLVGVLSRVQVLTSRVIGCGGLLGRARL